MSQLDSVRVSVTVEVDPDTAFEVFVDDIDEWYRKGVSTIGAPNPNATLRFEKRIGGRLLEIRPGFTRERASITEWEPGKRLAFVDKRSTEVEVTFEAVDRGTRVVLEHRGLGRLAPDLAERLGKHGWRRLAGWFEQHVDDISTDGSTG